MIVFLMIHKSSIIQSDTFTSTLQIYPGNCQRKSCPSSWKKRSSGKGLFLFSSPKLKIQWHVCRLLLWKYWSSFDMNYREHHVFYETKCCPRLLDYILQIVFFRIILYFKECNNWVCIQSTKVRCWTPEMLEHQIALFWIGYICHDMKVIMSIMQEF